MEDSDNEPEEPKPEDKGLEPELFEKDGGEVVEEGGKGGLGNESGLGGSVRAHIRPESIPPGLGSLWKPSRTPKRL